MTKFWLKLAEKEIKKYKFRQEGEIWFVDTIISDATILVDDLSEYENLDEVKNYIYEDLRDNIEINEFAPDCKEQIDIWIDEKLVHND